MSRKIVEQTTYLLELTDTGDDSLETEVIVADSQQHACEIAESRVPSLAHWLDEGQPWVQDFTLWKINETAYTSGEWRDYPDFTDEEGETVEVIIARLSQGLDMSSISDALLLKNYDLLEAACHSSYRNTPEVTSNCSSNQEHSWVSVWARGNSFGQVNCCNICSVCYMLESVHWTSDNSANLLEHKVHYPAGFETEEEYSEYMKINADRF